VSDRDIAVRVSAQISGLIDGFTNAASVVRAGGQQMQQGMAAAGVGAKEAGAQVASFSNVLQHYKAEQVQSERTARFFASSLTEIAPGAETAAGSLQKLISIGLEGFSIGAGIELAVFALGLLAERFREHEKLARELRQIHRETWQSAVDSLKQVERQVEGTTTATEAAFRSSTDSAIARVKKLSFEMEEAYKASSSKWRDIGVSIERFLTFGLTNVVKTTEQVVGEIQQKADAEFAGLNAAKGKKDETLAKERVKITRDVAIQILQIEASTRDRLLQIQADLKAELARLYDDRLRLGENYARLIAAAEAKAARETKEVIRQRALEHSRAMIAIEMATSNEYERLALQWALKQDEINERYRIRVDSLRGRQREEALRQRNEELAAENQKFAAQESMVAANIARNRLMLQKAIDDRLTMELDATRRAEAIKIQVQFGKSGGRDSSVELAATVAREQFETEEAHRLRSRLSAEQLEAKLTDIKRRGTKERGEILQREYAEEIAAAQTIGSSFADAFAGMATGAKSAAQAMAGVLKDVLNLVLQMAVKRILASAATAGAEAAESQAGIPVVGPILAIGAMASIFGAVMGMLSNVPKAARGAEIPFGMSPLVQLHSRELVLPETHADTIRQLGERGVGEGEHLHFHGTNIIDERSLRRFLGSESYIRASRDVRRHGRF
jgi:hypothetical protein